MKAATVQLSAVRGSDPRPSTKSTLNPTTRVISIDALRGLVMFTMIFVNDLAGAGRVVPNWMVHFSDRHPRGSSGMTFVDLVFPAFLFIVGMSIPFALGGRVAQSQPIWKTLAHVILRAVSLLFIGILMVHETPDTALLGWSGDWWCTLMYLSAIFAFSSFSPGSTKPQAAPAVWKNIGSGARLAGLAALIWLALAFRGVNNQRIVSLAPLGLSTSWYGILGLIGWAYLVVSIIFLLFQGRRTAILGSTVLLMCLFIASRNGAFADFWLNKIVGIGETLGSLASIAAMGLLLGSMLTAPEMSSFQSRTRFTFWLIAGCIAAALLLQKPYGISKNSATPSWCLWSCAITACLWYGLYILCDVRPVRIVSRPLAAAGRNVLLAYLISEMLPGLLSALGLGETYGHLAANLPAAIVRSTACAVLVLFVSTSLNRFGFWLKL